MAGLRREEVAVLAGVSTEWYTRLEKGHISGVSEDVLEAVARALRLHEEERTYLLDLAQAARPVPAPAAAGPSTSRPACSGCSTGSTSEDRFKLLASLTATSHGTSAPTEPTR